MKCVIYIIIFIRIILIIAEADANENESCVATRIAEEECGEHTYKAVRPLLKYIHQMKEKIENNNIKVESKDREIKQLQEELNQNNKQVIKELRAQNEFHKQSINELTNNVLSIKEEMGKLTSNALKIQDYEDQQEKQKKLIDQQAQQISELKNKINICDKKLKSCEEKPVYSECIDFADAPGIHKIKPDQEGPFNVLCDSATAGPGWTVIQQRINGKEVFHRNWTTYREGFGAFDGDFFLGLEMIHRLTSAQPHELYIHMEKVNGDIKTYRYEKFAIAGEDDQYKLITLGRGEGNAADCMGSHRNMKFSTFDRDNDQAGGNCASNYGGGWWYESCTCNCLLNGWHSYLTIVKPGPMCSSEFLKTVKILIRAKKIDKL